MARTMTTRHDRHAESRPDAIAHERRRTPRLEVYGAIEVQMPSVEAPVTLRDAGLGGFSIESDLPILPDAVHRVRFILDRGAEIELSARSSHCRRTPQGPARYVTGFAFIVDPTDGSREAIDLLVERLSAIVQGV